MKIVKYIILLMLFWSCERSSHEIDSEGDYSASRESGIVEGKVVENIIEDEKILSYSRSRKDKIEEIWQSVVDENDDLNRSILEIDKLFKGLDAQVEVLNVSILNYEGYFRNINRKIEQVQDSTLRLGLENETKKVKKEIAPLVEQMRLRIKQLDSLKSKYSDFVIEIKVRLINVLMKSYFEKNLVIPESIDKEIKNLKSEMAEFQKDIKYYY